MELNFQDELGRKSMMSEQSCYQIMLQTPTSWALTGDVPHLPIGNSPLDDWMNWFSNLGTISDRHTNSITQEYNAIKNNQFAKIPHHEITQHLTKVKQFEVDLNESFLDKCTHYGIDLDHLSCKDFLSTDSFPLTWQLPPALSEFNLEFINSNILGNRRSYSPDYIPKECVWNC